MVDAEEPIASSCNALTLIPPTFGELTAIASEIFEQSYFGGLCHLDIMTRTRSGVDFHVLGEKNLKSCVTHASIQTKFEYPDLGLTLIKRWVTSSTFYGMAKIKGLVACGFDVSGELSINPSTGEKSGVMTTSYKRDHIGFSVELESDSGDRRLLHLEAMCKLSNFVLGVHQKVDFVTHRPIHTSLACGYLTGLFALHTRVDDGCVFTSSMCQKTRPDLDSGFLIKFDSVQNTSYAAFGCMWRPSSLLSMRGKISTDCQLGLSVRYAVRPDLVLTFSTGANVGKAESEGMEFGVAIEFRG